MLSILHGTSIDKRGLWRFLLLIDTSTNEHDDEDEDCDGHDDKQDNHHDDEEEGHTGALLEGYLFVLFGKEG